MTRTALQALHGNRSSRELLSRLIERDRLPHALCLEGPAGVGKRTAALAMGKQLNCLKGGLDGCVCASCAKIDRGLHPDVRTIAADGAFIKIDQVRELLSLVRLKPYEGRAKLFIVDDADAMNEEAGNALLKTLEEPPPDTFIVLTSARPNVLLPTIRSRCRAVRFQPLPRAEIEAALAARGVDPEEARRRATFAGGSVGTAIALDLPSVEARRRRALAALQSLSRNPQASTLWQMAKAESADKEELSAWLEVLKELARDLALLARSRSQLTLAHPDLAPLLSALPAGARPAAGLRIYREVEATREALRGNAARQMAIEVLLLKARDILSS